MNVKLRLASIVVALLLPALLMARWLMVGTVVDTVHSLSLPTEVGAWRVTHEEQLDPDIWALIEPDAHLMRYYEAEGRTPIWVYIGLYAGRAGTGKGAHDPEICYPGQGWEITERRGGSVPVATSDTLEGTFLEAHLGAYEQTVLYWFQPAERWPAAPATEQLLRVYDAIKGSPQYAFVRFSGSSDGSSRAAEDLIEFAGAIAPDVRREVERSGQAVGESEILEAEL